MGLLKMFKNTDDSIDTKEEEPKELTEQMKAHYEALVMAKEAYYTAEELVHDLDYQNALELLGYPRTDTEINITGKKR